jgi:hypothetical protein
MNSLIIKKKNRWLSRNHKQVWLYFSHNSALLFLFIQSPKRKLTYFCAVSINEQTNTCKSEHKNENSNKIKRKWKKY